MASSIPQSTVPDSTNPDNTVLQTKDVQDSISHQTAHAESVAREPQSPTPF
ncbi:hypothetical protein ARALYDRAFT_911379 [Arabidopsis lyrata subsp. lyrata]|uniref:Uncharacterized protein n=1 Tax=Arabidopsis lyrata subsp. lyrata TaxID=81972 RepID=D7LYS1_ARALL|nr:hypothetical protein ARALYDRAFT_911379 [Arabidopsis lyrata subsp. lyrata]